MIARLFKWIAWILVALALLVVAVIYGAYFEGLRSMAGDFAPTNRQYSQAERMALWRSEGGVGEPSFGSEGPLVFAFDAWRAGNRGSDRRPDPDKKIRELLARRMSTGTQRRRILIWSAATIRIGKEWNDEQILDTALDRVYLGDRASGVAEAARRYFGKDHADLTPAQLQLLLALAPSPSHFDPWCHPDRLRERLTHAAVPALSPASAETTLQSLAPQPPEHACR